MHNRSNLITLGGAGRFHFSNAPSGPGVANMTESDADHCETGTQLECAPHEPLKVLVADHQPVVLAGVSALLARSADIQIVDHAHDGREAVDKFLSIRPDVGLFEVRLPVMDGVEAVRAILGKMPSARLVMFTSCHSEEDVYQAVRAGARGYVFKNAAGEELAQSISAVAAGQQWIPLVAAAQLARRIVYRELTPREQQVLLAITKGKSNKEIGVDLDIGEATVKVHVSHMLEKLKASGRTEAIRVAVQRGLVYLDAPMTA